MNSHNKKMFVKGYRKPAFCIIAPTAYLNEYATQSTTHLTLAHLVDTDASYAGFYKARSTECGDRIIMDCSAFELGESYAPDKLVVLGKRCGAHAIVLPDYPFCISDKTIQSAVNLATQVKEAGFATMFVPQSKTNDIEDWIAGYEWAANNDNIDIIGMSILGIPNAIPHIHIAYARVVMTQILIERGLFNFNKYHHYLGLNSGPGLEIPSLIQMGALDSCDSSGPVWAGILGHEYTQNADSLQSVSKVKAHVEFDYPMVKDKQTLERIQHNINLTLKLLDN
jgi:hypothetical protein